MAVLRARTTHELEARRHVIEEVAHRHRRTMQARPASALKDRAAAQRQLLRRVLLTSHLGLYSATDQNYLGYRRDAGERLTAKTECVQAAQILNGTNLASRMALGHALQFVLGNAVAVVSNAHEAQTATAQFDVDSAPPASSAFSTSSLTTDAGRSITSPAAMRSATSGGNANSGILCNSVPDSMYELIETFLFGNHAISLAVEERKTVRRPFYLFIGDNYSHRSDAERCSSDG